MASTLGKGRWRKHRVDPGALIRKRRLSALEAGLPGEPGHAHAVCTAQGRTARRLAGAAMHHDRQSARVIAQALLDGDENRESATERWRDAIARVEHTAARCAGAGNVVERTTALYGALETACTGPQVWEECAVPVALAIGATEGEARKAAAALARTLANHGADDGAARDTARALVALVTAITPVTGTEQRQGRRRREMREVVASALRRQCATRAVTEGAEGADLEPGLADGLTIIAQAKRALPRLADHARAHRAPDGAPCVVATATYPFNMKEKRFFNDRKEDGRSRRASNPATLEWIAANACVIPVGVDAEGKIAGETASGRLFAEHARLDPEGTLERLVVAGYRSGHAVARGLERNEAGDIALAGLAERLGKGKTDIATLPLDNIEGVAPEQWSASAPEPGKPVFVVVRPEEMIKGARENAADEPSPHHVTGTGTREPGTSEVVHPHALAITVGARLGGARDIVILSGETSQGLLFDKSQRSDANGTHDRNALISLPVHRSVANAAAMGAGAVECAWHPGAPRSPETDLFTAASDLYRMSGRETDDPERYDAEGGRATAFGQMEIWGETAEDRGNAIARRDVVEGARASTRSARRVTWLGAPERIGDVIELLSRTGWDAIELNIAQPVWESGDCAADARTAIAEHFPRGTARALPAARIEVEQTPGNRAEIALRPASTDALSWAKTDLVLLGDIDPANAEHWPALSWLSEGLRHKQADAPIAALGDSVFALNHGSAIVWGGARARLDAGLRGAAAEPDFVRAHPETARYLMAERHTRLDALAIVARPRLVALPSDDDTAEPWNAAGAQLADVLEHPGGKTVVASVRRAADDTEATLTRAVRIDPSDIEIPPSEHIRIVERNEQGRSAHSR